MHDRLAAIRRVIDQGPYTDDWASLARYETPAWYQNLKFGIFIHWGVFSVPAFANEWYSRNMYVQGSPEYEHHIATYGAHRDFGYKDFIPLFRAERFDPEAWAELFARAGARYVMPVAEHHDGFQMYRSALSHWNAYEMGPRRDVLGEIHSACRSRGLVCGASSHRVEHYWFMGMGKRFDSDIRDPVPRDSLYWPSVTEPDPFDMQSIDPEGLTPSEEFLEDWLLRTCELIDRYRPRILYFDWWIQHRAVRPWLQKLAAYYYNQAAARGETVVINYKHDAFPFGCAVPDVERGQFADMKPYFWQTDTAIAYNSWCWTEGNVFKPAEDLVRDLVDIVSKNGTFLLNVGPKPDGTISEQDRAVLEAIGDWMARSGEAIRDTRPWKLYGEGPTRFREGHFTDGERKGFTHRDVRYTRKGDCLYALALAPSPDGVYTFPALGTDSPSFRGVIREIACLDTDAPVAVARDAEGLHLRIPVRDGAMPVAFRIRVG